MLVLPGDGRSPEHIYPLKSGSGSSPGSIACFRFPCRTAQFYAVLGGEPPRCGPRRASDFALRAFCEVPNPSRRQAWALCTHDP